MSKARYVTLCQQLLATGCVLAVAVAAAGVMTLDIVAPRPRQATDWNSAVRVGEAYVESRPVAPVVRNVAVKGVAQPVAAPTSRAPGSPRPAGLRQAVVTPAETVSGFATLGATWSADDPWAEQDISFAVRTRTHRQWSEWTPLEYHEDHAADAPADERSGTRAGTEPLVVGEVRQAQLQVRTSTGQAPDDLRFALVDPGQGRVHRERGAATPDGDIAPAAMKVSPRPTIHTRSEWGADERLRSGSPSYGTIKTGFVHHTVNSNTYTREQVPALLRSIYAYHTQSRGWSDIGYNFLVDRFGQIWEGRYGGITRPVIGAHTLGYNEVSFAMSAIGNFEEVRPSDAMIDAYARLFAWKLSMYNIDASRMRIYVKNRYMNAINGHRDVGSTACPGRYLYERIPDIRKKAARIQQGAGSTPTPTPSPTPAPTPTIRPVPQSELPERNSIVGSRWPDLLLRQESTGRVFLQQTGGQLDFTTRAVQLSLGRGYSAAPAGDVTGDGRGDVIAHRARTGTTKVFAGDGAYGFAAPTSTTALSAYTSLIAPGDFTGDGRADLIGVERDTSRLMLLPRTSGFRFGTPVRLARDWSAYTKTIAMGDFNSDGAPDLLAKGTDGLLHLFAGRRTSLAAPTTLKVSMADVRQFVGGGDYTGDGVGDLLLRSASTGLVSLRPGDGRGGLEPGLGPFSVMSGMRYANGGGLTSDASAEIVGRSGDNEVTIADGNGLSNLGPLKDTGLVVPRAGQMLNAGDWNHDGNVDLITRPPLADRLVLRLGRGDGTFRDYLPLRRGFDRVPQLAALGDVTGDGNPDVVGRTRSGVMRIWPGDGKVGLRDSVRAPEELRSYNQIGRGLWNPTRSTTVVDSSDGSYVPFVGDDADSRLAVPGVAGRYDWVLGLGDANGDDQSDLVVRQPRTGRLWLLRGSSTGELLSRRLIGGGFGGFNLVG